MLFSSLPNQHWHIPASLRVCEMILPRRKYNIDLPNKQIIRALRDSSHKSPTSGSSRGSRPKGASNAPESHPQGSLNLDKG
jgi:hypothetical protein